MIQKLILELSSQGRSLECPGDYTEMKENLPNEVFPADGEPTRTLSMSLRGDKQSAAQSTDKLDTVHSNPSCPVKDPLIENCPSARSEAMELHVDLSGFANSDRQAEHVKLRHVDSCTEDTGDQPNASCNSGADQPSAHIPLSNDNLKSGPDPVSLPDDETWNRKMCPVPRLSLQVTSFISVYFRSARRFLFHVFALHMFLGGIYWLTIAIFIMLLALL